MEAQLADPDVWSDQAQSRTLGQERTALTKVIQSMDQLQMRLADLIELAALAEAGDGLQDEIEGEQAQIETTLAALEFRRMFNGAMDSAGAFVEIRPRAGGTEAQDWAEMLLRMYLRFGEKMQFTTELIELTAAETAGIRSAVVRFVGDYAFGWLRTEAGIHRLVRNSPFNAENKRHTSFAAVSVLPEVEDDVEVELDMADVRVDTYRASGAGGQHVNKTDSAIRLTHLPSGVVVQCQNNRSQHKNKEWAIKLLRSKLYEIEEEKRRQERETAMKSSQSKTSWGDQIRSYVLDQSRVKDHRSNIEHSNPTAVLDGRLEGFIEQSLKLGL